MKQNYDIIGDASFLFQLNLFDLTQKYFEYDRFGAYKFENKSSLVYPKDVLLKARIEMKHVFRRILRGRLHEIQFQTCLKF